MPRRMTASRIEGSIPGPSSSTAITIRSPSFEQVSLTRAQAHLQALSSRLPSISSRSSRCPWKACDAGASISILRSRSACIRLSVRISPSPDAATDARARRCGGCGGSRMRQVVVHLPPHAIDLLIDLRRELFMSCRPRLLRLMRQHSQRRLQTMREVTGLCDGARDPTLAFFEKRIQVVDQRLHLGRIAAAHARGGAFMHGREAVAQLIDRRQPSPYLQESEEHAERRYQSHPRPVTERQTKHAMGGRGRKREVENEGCDREQADRPEGGAEQDARFERDDAHWIR